MTRLFLIGGIFAIAPLSNAIAQAPDLSTANVTAGGATQTLSEWLTVPTQIVNGASLLALEYSNAAGTPAKIDIFPNSGAKPDEGNAAVAGTVAWAAAQLTGGGEIFVHVGAYTVATTITLSTAGTALVCADPQKAVFTAGASLNSVMVKLGWAGAQRQGMQVRNCGFSGNNGGNTSGTEVWVRDTANALVEDNLFTNAAKNAVIVDATVSGAVYNRVLHNNMAECVEECLVINGEGGASNATDSIIQGNTIGGSVIGDSTKPWVTVAGIGSLQFLGNHLSGPTHTDCIDFTNSSQSDVTISGNEFETCPNNGIVLGGGFNYTISDNLFYSNGTGTTNTYADINTAASFNNSITGNSFRANGVTKNGVFSSSGSYYNTIQGNIFNGYGGFAISLLNSFSGANTIGLNSYYANAGTYTLGGSHFFPSSVALSTTGALTNVPGALNENSIQLTQLGTGPTPTITHQGTAGAATWTYVVVPKDINGFASPASSAGSTTTGNGTLNGSNFNVVTFGTINGAYSYDVYRTAVGTSPTTTGLIGNVLATSVLAAAGNNYSLNDTGLAGNSAAAPTINQTGSNQAAIYSTTTNCSSGASPAVCGSAASGSGAVPTGTNPTLVVDTTAVTANSQIHLTPDESLSTRLSVTCNTTITTQGPLVVTARTPGVSFTVEVDATVGTNPVCFDYTIVN